MILKFGHIDQIKTAGMTFLQGKPYTGEPGRVLTAYLRPWLVAMLMQALGLTSYYVFLYVMILTVQHIQLLTIMIRLGFNSISSFSICQAEDRAPHLHHGSLSRLMWALTPHHVSQYAMLKIRFSIDNEALYFFFNALLCFSCQHNVYSHPHPEYAIL